MIQIPYWKKHACGLETILIEKHDSPIVKINIIFPYIIFYAIFATENQ